MLSSGRTRMTYVFLVGSIRPIPFGRVEFLITSAIKPASLAHALALWVFVDLARRFRTALVLVAKLGYDSGKVRSNARLRLWSRREDGRRLHLILSIHDGQDIPKVHALCCLWLGHRKLGHLRQRCRRWLLAEHVHCSLEVRCGRLRDWLLWGKRLGWLLRLLLLGCTLDDLQQVGDIELIRWRSRLRSGCRLRVDVGEVPFLSSLDMVGQFTKLLHIGDNLVVTRRRRFFW